MTVYKFRIYWDEDDNIYRDIAVLRGQNFSEFEAVILKAFEFDNKHEASFFVSDDKWKRKMEISSEVFVNKKDAAALAMIKTPVSALIAQPDQKFIFEYDRIKKQIFLIELIGIDKEEHPNIAYPHIFYAEGIAPLQSGRVSITNNQMLDVEEKYDLGNEDMEDGYGDEGEEKEHDDDSNESDYASDDSNSFDDF